MSGLDGLRLDDDGFLDMEQFPSDSVDLGDADLAELRAALLGDPVDEPSDDQWESFLDHAFEVGADTGDAPVADLDFDPVAEPGLFDTGDDASFADLLDADADTDDGAVDDLGLDDLGSDDLDDPFDAFDLAGPDPSEVDLPIDVDEPTVTTDDFEDPL